MAIQNRVELLVGLAGELLAVGVPGLGDVQAESSVRHVRLPGAEDHGEAMAHQKPIAQVWLLLWRDLWGVIETKDGAVAAIHHIEEQATPRFRVHRFEHFEVRSKVDLYCISAGKKAQATAQKFVGSTERTFKQLSAALGP